MDQFDIYEDLELLHAQEKQKSAEDLLWKEKYEVALSTIEKLQAEKKELNKKIKQMEINFASLLDTARTEIKRKDSQICELRKQKDDICFRRAKPEILGRQFTDNTGAATESGNLNPFSGERRKAEIPLPKKHFDSAKRKFDEEEKDSKTISQEESKNRVQNRNDSKDRYRRREEKGSRSLSPDKSKNHKRNRDCSKERGRHRHRERDRSDDRRRGNFFDRNDDHSHGRKDKNKKDRSDYEDGRNKDERRRKHGQDKSQTRSSDDNRDKSENLKNDHSNRVNPRNVQKSETSVNRTESLDHEKKSTSHKNTRTPLDCKTDNKPLTNTSDQTNQVNEKIEILQIEILKDVKEYKKNKLEAEKMPKPEPIDPIKLATEKSNKFLDALFDDSVFTPSDEPKDEQLYEDLHDVTDQTDSVTDKPKEFLKKDENCNFKFQTPKRSTALFEELFGPSPAGSVCSVVVEKEKEIKCAEESSSDLDFIPIKKSAEKQEKEQKLEVQTMDVDVDDDDDDDGETKEEKIVEQNSPRGKTEIEEEKVIPQIPKDVQKIQNENGDDKANKERVFEEKSTHCKMETEEEKVKKVEKDTEILNELKNDPENVQKIQNENDEHDDKTNKQNFVDQKSSNCKILAEEEKVENVTPDNVQKIQNEDDYNETIKGNVVDQKSSHCKIETEKVMLKNVQQNQNKDDDDEKNNESFAEIKSSNYKIVVEEEKVAPDNVQKIQTDKNSNLKSQTPKKQIEKSPSQCNSDEIKSIVEPESTKSTEQKTTPMKSPVIDDSSCEDVASIQTATQTSTDKTSAKNAKNFKFVELDSSFYSSEDELAQDPKDSSYTSKDDIESPSFEELSATASNSQQTSETESIIQIESKESSTHVLSNKEQTLSKENCENLGKEEETFVRKCDDTLKEVVKTEEVEKKYKHKKLSKRDEGKKHSSKHHKTLYNSDSKTKSEDNVRQYESYKDFKEKHRRRHHRHHSRSKQSTDTKSKTSRSPKKHSKTIDLDGSLSSKDSSSLKTSSKTVMNDLSDKICSPILKCDDDDGANDKLIDEDQDQVFFLHCEDVSDDEDELIAEQALNQGKTNNVEDKNDINATEMQLEDLTTTQTTEDEKSLQSKEANIKNEVKSNELKNDLLNSMKPSEHKIDTKKTVVNESEVIESQSNILGCSLAATESQSLKAGTELIGFEMVECLDDKKGEVNEQNTAPKSSELLNQLLTATDHNKETHTEDKDKNKTESKIENQVDTENISKSPTKDNKETDTNIQEKKECEISEIQTLNGCENGKTLNKNIVLNADIQEHSDSENNLSKRMDEKSNKETVHEPSTDFCVNNTEVNLKQSDDNVEKPSTSDKPVCNEQFESEIILKNQSECLLDSNEQAHSKSDQLSVQKDELPDDQTHQKTNEEEFSSPSKLNDSLSNFENIFSPRSTQSEKFEISNQMTEKMSTSELLSTLTADQSLFSPRKSVNSADEIESSHSYSESVSSGRRKKLKTPRKRTDDAKATITSDECHESEIRPSTDREKLLQSDNEKPSKQEENHNKEEGIVDKTKTPNPSLKMKENSKTEEQNLRKSSSVSKQNDKPENEETKQETVVNLKNEKKLKVTSPSHDKPIAIKSVEQFDKKSIDNEVKHSSESDAIKKIEQAHQKTKNDTASTETTSTELNENEDEVKKIVETFSITIKRNRNKKKCTEFSDAIKRLANDLTLPNGSANIRLISDESSNSSSHLNSKAVDGSFNDAPQKNKSKNKHLPNETQQMMKHFMDSDHLFVGECNYQSVSCANATSTELKSIAKKRGRKSKAEKDNLDSSFKSNSTEHSSPNLNTAREQTKRKYKRKTTHIHDSSNSNEDVINNSIKSDTSDTKEPKQKRKYNKNKNQSQKTTETTETTENPVKQLQSAKSIDKFLDKLHSLQETAEAFQQILISNNSESEENCNKNKNDEQVSPSIRHATTKFPRNSKRKLSVSSNDKSDEKDNQTQPKKSKTLPDNTSTENNECDSTSSPTATKIVHQEEPSKQFHQSPSPEITTTTITLSPNHHKTFSNDDPSPPMYNANEDDEIYNRMRSLFHSPPYTSQPVANEDCSLNNADQTTFSENITVNETTTSIGQADKTQQCDTSISSARKVSLGSNEYVIESVGTHTANVFITRRKCKKRTKAVAATVA